MTKNIQKLPKNGAFGLFRKIYLLVLSGNGVEWKYLWPFSILRKLDFWEKSGSQPVKFHYPLINNISLMDWHLTLIFCL